MPKTKKKFDWEVYDNKGEFIDILSMTRNDAKIYLQENSEHILKEIEYTNDGGNNSRESSSIKNRDIYCIRIQDGRKRLKNVYKTPKLGS